MPRPVPFVARLLDSAGVVLFLTGAGLYGWAWRGLHELQRVQPASPGAGFAAIEEADRLNALSHAGVMVMTAGLVVAVIAAVVARLRGPRS